MMMLTGIEPVTSCSKIQVLNQLSYNVVLLTFYLLHQLGARLWVHTLLKYEMPNRVYISGYYPLLCVISRFQDILGILSPIIIEFSSCFVRLEQNSYSLLISFRELVTKRFTPPQRFI